MSKKRDWVNITWLTFYVENVHFPHLTQEIGLYAQKMTTIQHFKDNIIEERVL